MVDTNLEENELVDDSINGYDVAIWVFESKPRLVGRFCSIQIETVRSYTKSNEEQLSLSFLVEKGWIIVDDSVRKQSERGLVTIEYRILTSTNSAQSKDYSYRLVWCTFTNLPDDNQLLASDLYTLKGVAKHYEFGQSYEKVFLS